jgi:hypothetical protein
VAFNPQGLAIVAKWRQLIPLDVPLVTIDGIGDAEMVRQKTGGCGLRDSDWRGHAKLGRNYLLNGAMS